jgi:hypothetical protein
VTAFSEADDFPAVQGATKGIIFLSTPHRGSNSAKGPKVLADVLNNILSLGSGSFGSFRSDLLEALSKDSSELKTLAIDFRKRAVDIKIVSFYETDATPPLRDKVIEPFHEGPFRRF